jgi:hypothetical protein
VEPYFPSVLFSFPSPPPPPPPPPPPHLSLKGHELDALAITIDERGPAEAGVA